MRRYRLVFGLKRFLHAPKQGNEPPHGKPCGIKLDIANKILMRLPCTLSRNLDI
jgi:hypothetical protein